MHSREPLNGMPRMTTSLHSAAVDFYDDALVVETEITECFCSHDGQPEKPNIKIHYETERLMRISVGGAV